MWSFAEKIMQNNLRGTRTYLIGHMQYKDGSVWRKSTQAALEKLGVRVYNPYDKPYLESVEEGPAEFERLKTFLKDGRLDKVRESFSKVRNYDLALVDKSDFIICHLYPEVASWGTGEELFTASLQRKPVFISIEGGRTKCPIWIAASFPDKYIYNDQKEIMDVLARIDSGEIKPDSDRWRLLKPDFR